MKTDSDSIPATEYMAGQEICLLGNPDLHWLMVLASRKGNRLVFGYKAYSEALDEYDASCTANLYNPLALGIMLAPRQWLIDYARRRCG